MKRAKRPSSNDDVTIRLLTVVFPAPAAPTSKMYGLGLLAIWALMLNWLQLEDDLNFFLRFVCTILFKISFSNTFFKLR